MIRYSSSDLSVSKGTVRSMLAERHMQAVIPMKVSWTTTSPKHRLVLPLTLMMTMIVR